MGFKGEGVTDRRQDVDRRAAHCFNTLDDCKTKGHQRCLPFLLAVFVEKTKDGPEYDYSQKITAK